MSWTSYEIISRRWSLTCCYRIESTICICALFYICWSFTTSLIIYLHYFSIKFLLIYSIISFSSILIYLASINIDAAVETIDSPTIWLIRLSLTNYIDFSSFKQNSPILLIYSLTMVSISILTIYIIAFSSTY